MEGVVDLQLWQLISAYVFVVILLMIVRAKGIPKEKEILIASVRMTLQLILMGYILVYVFDHANPLYTLIIFIIMVIFAINNIFKRVKSNLSQKIRQITALSMILGTVVSLLYFTFIVIRFDPWYDPRYFIPIAGMIIGNSMTGITLGVSRLVEGMNTQKPMIEGALMLGATPKVAAKPIVDNAFETAILPTINSMVGMGIVFLPGMMTGQILSGVSPVTAIEYQIAIMLGILGSVALSIITFVQLGYKTFFNEQDQIT